MTRDYNGEIADAELLKVPMDDPRHEAARLLAEKLRREWEQEQRDAVSLAS